MNLLDSLLGRRPEALLFDLDGTLIDSVPDLAAALDIALHHSGYTPAAEGAARNWVGNGARKLVQRALADAQGIAEDQVDEAELDRVLPVFFAAYDQCCTRHTVLYAGVREALSFWHQAGIRMACVTNKPAGFSTKILKAFELERFMPVLIGGDTLPQRKPSPEPLLEACRQLGVLSMNAVMVGDSANDVQAARAAGMPVIAVPYGYNYGGDVAACQPDLLVERLDYLLG